MEFPKVEQPENLSIKLFDHQLTSIYNMEKLESGEYLHPYSHVRVKTKIGFFGDIPGYGKSLSIVSLILRDRMTVGPYQVVSHFVRKMNHEGALIYEEETFRSHEVIPCTLLVCGASIITQWEEYFSFSPLRIKVVKNKKDADEYVPSEVDVVIVLPSFYNQFVRRFPSKFWKRFIYDEPTAVHIPAMEFVNSCFYWFVTATYNSLGSCFIQGNRSHMLVDLFKHQGWWQGDRLPDRYRLFLIENPQDYIKKSFSMPSVHNVKHLCYSSRVLEVIGDYISQETAELITAGDFKQAVASLGGDTFNGNIIDYVSQKIKNEIEKYQKKLDKKLANPFKPDASTYEKLRYTEKLKTYEKSIAENKRQLSIIEERFQRMLADNDCPICGDTLEKAVMVKCCQNVFCGSCIFGWLQGHKTCPYCRAAVKLKELVHIDQSEDPKIPNGKEEEKKNEVPVLGRPETVVQLLQKITSSPEKRIILFSSSDHTFSVIKNFLKTSHLEHAEVKGSVARRSSILSKYHSGEIPILFLNSKYNGAGINLQNTTDIIIYHDMNEDTIKQITGRALRVGRSEDLYVHTLVETHDKTVPSVGPSGSTGS